MRKYVCSFTGPRTAAELHPRPAAESLVSEEPKYICSASSLEANAVGKAEASKHKQHAATPLLISHSSQLFFEFQYMKTASRE